jgi:hypothetical protein
MFKKKYVLFLTLIIMLVFINPVAANSWEMINYSNPDTISEMGLSVEEFNALTQSEWLDIIGESDKISFAFHSKDSTGKNITAEINPNISINVVGSNTEEISEFPKVNYQNEAPIFTNLKDKSILETEVFNYQLTAQDPNRNKTTFKLINAEELPSELNMNQGLLTWITDFDDEGAYEVLVQVSDGELVNESSFILTVNHKNAPPVLENLESKEVYENELIEFQIPASDIDGDILIFNSSNLPDGANLSADGLFSWKPEYTDSGKYVFTVNLYDGTDIVSKDYTVNVMDRNAPPIIENIPNQTIKENDLFSYQVEASDIDGDNLSYSIGNKSELPDGLTISSSGLIEWKTDYSNEGNYNIIIEVSDGVLKNEATINLNVEWYQIEKTYLYFNGHQDTTATRVTSNLSYINENYFELEAEIYLNETPGSFVQLIGSSVGNNINGGIKLSGKRVMFHDYSTYGGDRDIAKTDDVLTLNEWQNIKLIYDNGNIKIYRNGVLESSGSFNLNSRGTLIIGAPSSLSTHEYRRFKGYIRNAVVRDSNSVLGEYLLQDGTGTTAKDQTNNNNGSIINPVWQKNYISHDKYN